MWDIFRTKDGQTIFRQKPNWQITAAFTCWLVSIIVQEGTIHAFLRAMFILFLGIWAFLEITEGVNLFRKLLGTAVGIYLILSLLS